MLKIKDNFDIEELKKFGFYKNGTIYSIRIPEEKICSGDYIDVVGNTQHINVIMTGEAGYMYDETLDKLFDLIQSGMVEKVKE